MWDYLLLQLEVLMLTLESFNAKTVGDGVTQLSLAGSKGQSASNVIVPTNQRTTANSDGVAKQTRKQILHDLKPKREIHVPTHSGVWTVEAITKLILFNACFENTISIESGNKRNISRSVKIRLNQFALQEVANIKYDNTKSQSIFTKCLKKFTYCQRLARDSYPTWHHIHPRATLV